MHDLSAQDARGPEDNDAPLEWRAPSKEVRPLERIGSRGCPQAPRRDSAIPGNGRGSSALFSSNCAEPLPILANAVATKHHPAHDDPCLGRTGTIGAPAPQYPGASEDCVLFAPPPDGGS